MSTKKEWEIKLWEKQGQLVEPEWLIDFIRRLLSEQKSKWDKNTFEYLIPNERSKVIEEIEEHIITRLGEIRFSGLEGLCDKLSTEIKLYLSSLNK
jgi:hypothetical protein